MQVFSTIKRRSLHNKTFWLGSKKNTSRRLICLWKWDLKHCSLWPVNSWQSSPGHIKGILSLVSRKDVHPSKAMGSRGSTTLVPQQRPGCWVCGAAAACRGEAGSSRGLQARRQPHSSPCPGEFPPHLSQATRVRYRTVWQKQIACFQSIRLGVGSLEFITRCWFWTHYEGAGSDGF